MILIIILLFLDNVKVYLMSIEKGGIEIYKIWYKE